MNHEREARLDALLAKQEIHDRLMLYVRGVDRGESDLITQAFHPDGIADHGQFVFRGSDIGEVVPKLEAQVSTGMHFLGNELIEIEGDRAHVEVYFLTFAEVDRDGETYLMSRGARYVDLWERREDAWRISYRIVVVDWGSVDPIKERWPGADKLYMGERGLSDPVFRIDELAAVKASLEAPTAEETLSAFVGRMATAGFAEKPGEDGAG